MASWFEAIPDAMKVLGDKAQLPKMPDTVDKAQDVFGKANHAFLSTRDTLESNLLAMQNALSAEMNVFKQFRAKVEKSDFFLDSGNKEEAKKIGQARKILTTGLDGDLKFKGELARTLDELDKHLVQLGKYKAPAQ